MVIKSEVEVYSTAFLKLSYGSTMKRLGEKSET